MSYWELDPEPWEQEDNWDGAHWITNRGRQQILEKLYQLSEETSSS